MDHLKEEEKEVREDSKNEKNRTFFIWDKVAWGALIILCAAIFGGGNKNDTSKKELGCKITILCYMNGIGLLFV